MISDGDMLRHLVKMGVDINFKDENGNTALMRVSANLLHMFKSGLSWDKFKTLIEEGADVTIENNSHETALWLVSKVHADVVSKESKILLEPYAKLLVDNGAGEAELIKAYSEGNYEYAFSILYAGKLDVNKENAEGKTLYSLALKALKDSDGDGWATDWLKDMLKEAKKGDVNYRIF